MSDRTEHKNIVDYFYTCGIDLSIGLEAFASHEKNGDSFMHLPPLERPYRCRILQHFPEYSPNCPFDAESTALVTMPRGLRLFTQNDASLRKFIRPQRHTFIITREDGTRVHGMALLFPEEIVHDGLKAAVSSLQKMYAAEVALTRTSKSPNKSFESSTATFVPYEKGDTLFAVKAIGLLSRFAFIHGLFSWLEDIWATMFVNLPRSPYSNIESCIKDLLFSTKLPVCGSCVNFVSPFRSHYGYLPAPCTIIQAPLNGLFGHEDTIELPLFEYSLYDLFNVIGLEDFIRLFTCTLLEFRIILFSKSYYRLMMIAEGITCLLLPFNWPHVYAPILPASLVHFVDAPVPYIMGINVGDTVNSRKPIFCTNEECESSSSLKTQHNGFQRYVELASEANVCYVHADEGRVIVPDEVPQFPHTQSIQNSIIELLKIMETSHKASVSARTNGSEISSVAPVPRPRPPNSLTNMPSSTVTTSFTTDASPTTSETEFINNRSQPKLGSDCQTMSDSVYSSDDLISADPAEVSEQRLYSFHEAQIDAATALVSIENYPKYTQLLHFNTAVRNIFLSNFVNIFHDYENFLVLDKTTIDPDCFKPLCSGLQAFDKVGFLSDQPETHLPFLSAFLETQMFTSFLDQRMNWHLFFHTQSPPTSMAKTRPQLPLPVSLKIFYGILNRTQQKTATMKNMSPTVQATSELGLASPSESRFPSCIWPGSCSNHVSPNSVVVAAAAAVAVRRRHSGRQTGKSDVKNPLPDLIAGASKLKTSTDTDYESNSAYSETPSRPNGHFPNLSANLLVPPPSHEPLATDEQENATNNSTPALILAPRLNPHLVNLRSDNSDAPASRTPLHRNQSNNRIVTSPLIDQSQHRSPTVKAEHSNMVESPLAASLIESQVSRAISNRFTRSFAQTHQFADLQRFGMAQANWDFVDALLDECKHRTKRMVLKKIGQEAVEMGHVDPSVSVVEENTLVSGLCDLLERIWSHGLNAKHGKSALWSHLQFYFKRHATTEHASEAGQCPETANEPFEPSSSSSNSSSCANSPCPTNLSRHSRESRARLSGTQPNSPDVNNSGTVYRGNESSHASAYTNYSSLKRFRKFSNTATLSSQGSSVQPKQSQQQQHRASESLNRLYQHTRFSSQDRRSESPAGSTMANWRARFQLSDWRSNTSSQLASTGRKPSLTSYYPIPAIASTNPFFNDASGVGSVLDLRNIFGREVVEPSLTADIALIQGLKGVKTDIGCARAFVRLALEKKLLSSHLTRLLMDSKLLRRLYTRYAFLRCEEGREQFLVHLLSLNAVDYYSFTRMLTMAELVYQIFICSSRKHGGYSTANSWVKVNGHLGSTQMVVIPRGHNLIEIRNRNLGQLSTVQLGHDNSGSAPKWFVEFVLIRNVATNHLYLFPCYHWFGHGIEDDALERILIGEQIRLAPNDPHLLFTAPSSEPGEYVPNLPNRCLSPSVSRKGADNRNLNAMIIHERLAGAVNRLMKHLYQSGRQNAVISLAALWCGEQGIVPSLQLVFSYAFRSSRLFQRKIYVWDYLEKVASSLITELDLLPERTAAGYISPESDQLASTKSLPFSTHSLPRSAISRSRKDASMVPERTMHPSPSFSVVRGSSIVDSSNAGSLSLSQPNSPALNRVKAFALATVAKNSLSNIRKTAEEFVKCFQAVTESSATLGKEGKLQRLICRALRNHQLCEWFSLLALSSVTSQMYEPKCFLLNHDLRHAIQRLIATLDEFEFPLDPALLGPM